MSRIVEAVYDENGKLKGGKAGDQTGKEVLERDWRSSFKYTHVFRFKDRDKAEQFAKILKWFAACDKIGYDQDNRNGLFDMLKKTDFKNYKAVTAKTECVCSTLIITALWCIGYKFVPRGTLSGNMIDLLKKSGKFTCYTGSKYLMNGDYLKTGDILVRDGHIGAAVSNGKKTKTPVSYDGVFPTLPKKGYFDKGDTGAQVKYLQKFLNWYGNYGLTIDGSYGPLTVNAVKYFENAEGLTKDGSFGAKCLVKAKAAKK